MRSPTRSRLQPHRRTGETKVVMQRRLRLIPAPSIYLVSAVAAASARGRCAHLHARRPRMTSRTNIAAVAKGRDRAPYRANSAWQNGHAAVNRFIDTDAEQEVMSAAEHMPHWADEVAAQARWLNVEPDFWQANFMGPSRQASTATEIYTPTSCDPSAGRSRSRGRFSVTRRSMRPKRSTVLHRAR